MNDRIRPLHKGLYCVTELALSTPLHVCNFTIRKNRQSHTPVLTDHKAQWLFLAKTLSPREDFFDPSALFDVLSASAFPRHQRTDLAREISLREDVIRDVREAFTALHVRRVEADTLRRSAMMMMMHMCMRTVHIFIMHPNSSRSVRCMSFQSAQFLGQQIKRASMHTYDETKRGCRGVSNAASEQILDGVARLETRGGDLFPIGDRAPLRVHEPLLEDVVEDILKVEHVGDVNELCSHRPLRARRLVVGDPEIRSRIAGRRNAVSRDSHIVVETERRECARQRRERM